MTMRRRAAAAAGALITVAALAVGSPAYATGTAPAGVTHEQNPRVPEGAVWTEAYFPSADHSGVQLHADVLRPANLPAHARTPVILAVGPYFSHAGQTGPEGWTRTGPAGSGCMASRTTR
jgi:uncharacterized protein